MFNENGYVYYISNLPPNNKLMKPTVKMILWTLLGLILPFGAIWGPLLVKTESKQERRFRSRLLIAEVVVWVLGMLPLVFFWYSFMQQLSSSNPEIGAPVEVFVYPVLLVLLACVLLISSSLRSH